MSTTLAVVSQSGQSLSLFNLTTGLKIAQIEDLPAEPHELAFDSRTNLLYISHTYTHGWYAAHGDFVSLITVFDCDSSNVVDTIDISPYLGPHYLQIDKDRNLLYASVEGGIADANGLTNNESAGGIVAIDLLSRRVTTAIASGHKSHWFAMTPDGCKAYTCNKEAGFISVIDLVAERLLKCIELPGGCEQPGISRDGARVFLPSPAIGQKGHQACLKIVDTRLDEISGSIPLRARAVTVHVDSRDRLLVGLYDIEVDEATKKPVPSYGGVALFQQVAGKRGDFHYNCVDTVKVGLVPLTILADGEGREAYLSNIFQGTVSVVNLDAMRIEKTLVVDDGREKRVGMEMHQGAHGLALI